MAARCGEDLDLSAVGPAAKRVGVDAEDAARLPQRQPVTVLERRRLGDTVNLGETGADMDHEERRRRRFRMLTPAQTAVALVAIVIYCAVVILVPLPLFFLYPVGGVLIAVLLFVPAPRFMRSRRR